MNNPLDNYQADVEQQDEEMQRGYDIDEGNYLERKADELADLELRKPYTEMSIEVLRDILNHNIDHDCRCTDPESSCSVCYKAWNELELNRKEKNHHYI